MAGLLQALYQWKAQAQENALKPIYDDRYKQAMMATGYAPRPAQQMEMPGGGFVDLPGTEGSGYLSNPADPRTAMNYASQLKTIPGFNDIGSGVAAQTLSQFSPDAIQAQHQAARQSQFMQGIQPGMSREELAYRALQAPTDNAAARVSGYMGAVAPEAVKPPWYITDNGVDPRAIQYAEAMAPKGSTTNVNVGNAPLPYDLPKNYMLKDPQDPYSGVMPVPGGPDDPKAAKAIEFPEVEDNFNSTIGLLKAIKTHPGKGYAVGKSSVMPMVPGTQAFDFKTRLEQMQGKQFLEAYQQLKGGGTITEIEGNKAEAAMARLSRAQTEPAFDGALDEFIGVLETGYNRARKQAGLQPIDLKSGEIKRAGSQYDKLKNKYGLE